MKLTLALLAMLCAGPALAKCHETPKHRIPAHGAVARTDPQRHTAVPFAHRDTVWVAQRGEACRIHYRPRGARESQRDGSSLAALGIVGAVVIGAVAIANSDHGGSHASATATAGGAGCPPPEPPKCPRPKPWH